MDAPSEKKFSTRKGLVLEGGAMRGLFSAGVMDVLMAHDFRFDAIAGVSAGAAFGCNYKSGQIGRVLRYNKRFCRDKRFCSWSSLLKTGDLFGADFCYRELPDHLDPFDRRAFESDPADFWIVCTDVHTGEARYQLCNQADEDCFKWMRASASMPFVSRTVAVGGGEYLDGALADSIPLAFLRSQGCGKNVVILTQPRGYVKRKQKGMVFFAWALRKYPQLVQSLERRHERYNAALRLVDELEKKNEIFVFRPENPLPLGRLCHDPELLQAAYDIGRNQALRRLPELTAFFKSS